MIALFSFTPRKSLPFWGLLLALFLPMEGRTSEEEGALHALHAAEASLSGKGPERILGVVGFYGQPQPPQWLVLTSLPGKTAVLREWVVSKGRVLAERRFSPVPGQDLPNIPIELERLKIDSRAAFTVAERVAKEKRMAFDSAHFQLRCRDAGEEPVWMLSLITAAQVSVGAIYLSAETGEVLRVSWVKPPVETFSSVRE